MSNSVTYTQPTNFAVDVGIITIGGTQYFRTRRGITYNPGLQLRDVPYDGKTADYEEGLTRIIKRAPSLKCKVLEQDGANWLRYEPGSSSDGSPTTNLITLKAGRAFWSGSDYTSNVRWVASRSDGSTVRL